MARPLRIQYPGAFYHVTSRGNEQKIISKSRRDREKFCEYLGTASSRYGAVVHCYCLMDNYHLTRNHRRGTCRRSCAISTVHTRPTSTSRENTPAIFFRGATRRFWSKPMNMKSQWGQALNN